MVAGPLKFTIVVKLFITVFTLLEILESEEVMNFAELRKSVLQQAMIIVSIIATSGTYGIDTTTEEEQQVSKILPIFYSVTCYLLLS